MIRIDGDKFFLSGPKGIIELVQDDEITLKLGMLYEGECEANCRAVVAEKFGYTRQRYYQLLQQFKSKGAAALKNRKQGPKGNYRRTDEVVRQVIRYRFLDPRMSPEVITQKLQQTGHQIAIRTVERVIGEYGLQKKTPSVSSGTVARRG
jgi:transposase